MKKYVSIILVVLMIIGMLASCNSNDNSNKEVDSVELSIGESESEKGYILNPPKVDPGDAVDSSGVTAEIVDKVTTSSERINVKITGSNIEGNYLHYFEVPALEKKVNGEWVGVPMTESSTEYLRGDPGYFWSLGFRQDSDIMWTTVYVETKNLCEKITVGEYRACVFLFDKNLYVEFSVEE